MAKTNKSTLKKVNLFAKKHIKGTSYPTLYGYYKGIVLPLKDIKICLDNKADVQELLSDGTLVKFNKNNYDEDNEFNYSKKKKLTSITPGFEKVVTEEVDPPVSVGSSFIPKEIWNDNLSETEE